MINKYKYRFKTKKEFIKEYGENWRGDNHIYWNIEMDYLLGTIFEYDMSVFNNKDRFSISRQYGYGDWILSIHHLKKNTPLYEPKTFVYG